MPEVSDAGPIDGRGIGRLVTSSDGVVAIALTLLVLPLVDVAKETADHPVGTVVRDHVGDFLAFVLSFLVIAQLWRVHHRLFDLVDRFDDRLLMLNAFWLLGVVFLPAPTAVLALADDPGHGAAVLYAANLVYVMLLGLAMGLWVRHRPELQRPGTSAAVSAFTRRAVVTSGFAAVTAALATLLGPTAFVLLALLPLSRRLSRIDG